MTSNNISQKIQVFDGQKVRSVWSEEEQQWYFAIPDVCRILTESDNPQTYWRVLKNRLKKEGNETVTNCNALKLLAADGKMRLTDVANQAQLFRIIKNVYVWLCLLMSFVLPLFSLAYMNRLEHSIYLILYLSLCLSIIAVTITYLKKGQHA